MSDKLPIGTRIQFVKQLDADATGDHPAIIYARKDEHGSIVSYEAKEGYLVKTDNWPASFGAIHKEEFVEYFQPMDHLTHLGFTNRCDTFDTYSKKLEDYTIHVSKYINDKHWVCTLTDNDGNDEITINYDTTLKWIIELENILSKIK